MQVGEVRIADDNDFHQLKELCEEVAGWVLEYNKSSVRVWTKDNDLSDFKIVKVKTTFNDVSAATLYDVLHDPEYRKLWDFSMLEADEICALNPNNDVGYYAIKFPSPFKNRDFVTLRSWLATATEYYIMNHSVSHVKHPPYNELIRGISYLTGYFVLPVGEKTCHFTYVTQSDPKGKLPSWAVNKATQILAPKVVKRIHKACRNYNLWKSKNKPFYKPWLYPEQCKLPRLEQSHIKAFPMENSQESLDESGMCEDDFKDDEL